MNLNKIRGNVGWLFKLQPPAIHLDPQGRELPCRDEEWLLRDVSVDGAAITLSDLTINGLCTKIGADVVHHFDTDLSRGTRHGLLMLKQQIFIQADTIAFRLCFRPGERVDPPPPVEVTRIPVSFDFLQKTGIQKRLDAEGFEVNGVIELRLAELERNGWECIVESDRHGRPTIYYLPDPRPGMNLIFIKRRKPVPPQRVRMPLPAR